MLRKPLEVLSRSDLKYALTTYQRRDLVQNYLFPSRVDFYIDPTDLPREGTALLFEGGARRKGEHSGSDGDTQVFYGASERSGLNIVSIPQLIVDLLTEGGVCVEAAEMLMEKEGKKLVSPSGL